MNKQTFRKGQLVWDAKGKRQGKFITYNRDNKTATVEFIIEFNKESGERTTKLDNVEVSNLRKYINKSSKFKKDTLLFAKVRKDAIIPSKNYEDAGYDIYANFEEDFVRIKPNEIKMISTGIASSVLSKYVLLVRERGSTGTKGMSVRAGVIDSGYRGEIFIPINNTSDRTIVISKLDFVSDVEDTIVHPYEKAIAQLLLLPVPNVDVKEISYDDLKKIPSKRGQGALGNSGK